MSEPSPYFHVTQTGKKGNLARNLGLFSVYCFASGAMISSGLFILPGLAHAHAGAAVILSYLLSGILISFGVLCICELATAMPKAGGDYFFIVRTMGPVIGTVSGLLSWFALSLKSSFALVGMSAFLAYWFGIDIKMLALGLCVIFVVLNILGTSHVAKTQIVIVSALFIIIIIYCIGGVSVFKPHNIRPFFPKKLISIVSVAGMVFISYGGILKISSISEEIANPGKTIPRAILLSLVTVIILYMITIFITSGILDDSVLNNSLTPLNDAVKLFLGKPGDIAISIAAVCAFVSTALAGIMAASRYLLALSRDNLVPPVLGTINERFNTPHAAIVFTGIFIALSLFLEIEFLAKAASTVLILTCALTCAAVIVLRESKIESYRPTFKSPFYPYLQIIGILGYTVLIFEMGNAALVTAFVFILSGFAVYWYYGRKFASKEYALIHLVEQLVSRDFGDHSLESELRNIINERDNTEKNELYTLIENCEILDITEQVGYKHIFDLVSKKIVETAGGNQEHYFNDFIERETTYPTIVKEYVAIPHIILKGAEKFLLYIIRCKHGIEFPNGQRVKTAFVIAGSADLRQFHLTVLAFIAKIVNTDDFLDVILAARDQETIRNIIIFKWLQ